MFMFMFMIMLVYVNVYDYVSLCSIIQSISISISISILFGITNITGYLHTETTMKCVFIRMSFSQLKFERVDEILAAH